MKKNMGSADRIIRIIIFIAVAILFFTGVIPHLWWGWALLGLATISLITSFVSFCPLYLPFGLNTVRKKLSR